MKIALIHDWLIGMRGGEKVLECLCELYPEATIFTLLYDPAAVSDTIRKMKIVESPYLKKLPFGRNKYRYYLPFFPVMIEQFNLQDYDLVISTSHCVAKGVITKPETMHICYCFTPVRYVWDMYYDYFSNPFQRRISSYITPLVTTYLRLWDQSSKDRVDHYIAIARNIARKISKYYRRDASILYPPVDYDFFQPSPQVPSDYYLIVSALVPYKKIDLAIEAFNELKLPLKIAGVGPEMKKWQQLSQPNIEFLGWVDNPTLRELYSNCHALIFPGEEDFGIVPLEAMSCGRPVIAYGKGGQLETIQPGINGIFFQKPTKTSLIDAVRQFQTMEFDSILIRKSVASFRRDLFKQQFNDMIQQYIHHPGMVDLTKQIHYPSSRAIRGNQ